MSSVIIKEEDTMANKKTETKKDAKKTAAKASAKTPAKSSAKSGNASAAKQAAAKKPAAKKSTGAGSSKKPAVKSETAKKAGSSAKATTTKKAGSSSKATTTKKTGFSAKPAAKKENKKVTKPVAKKAGAANSKKAAAPAAKASGKAAAKKDTKKGAKTVAGSTKSAVTKKAPVKSAANNKMKADPKTAAKNKSAAKAESKGTAKKRPAVKADPKAVKVKETVKAGKKTAEKTASKKAEEKKATEKAVSGKNANGTEKVPAKPAVKETAGNAKGSAAQGKGKADPKTEKKSAGTAISDHTKKKEEKKTGAKDTAKTSEKEKVKKKPVNDPDNWDEDSEDDLLYDDSDEDFDYVEDELEPRVEEEEEDPEQEALKAGFEEKLKSVIDNAKKDGYIDYHEVINAFAIFNLDEEQFDRVWEALDKNRIVLRIEPAVDDIPEEELALEEADEIELDLETLEQDVPDDTGINDPVKMYLKEIGRVQLLSADEEVELAKQMEDGLAVEAKYEELRLKLDIQQKAYDIAKKKKKATKEYATNIEQLTKKISAYEGKVETGRAAGQKLVSANLRLVVNIAKRYVGRGMHFLDLIQEGNLGLMKAVEKFDYRKGYKFSTYATWWIRQAITRAIADQARTIRIPVHMVETINKIIRINRQLLQELGREPSPQEIAEKMDMPEERVREILKISQEPVSLETPIGEEEDSHLGDFIQDDYVPIPADAAAQTLLHEQLNEILRTLTDRERRVLKLRFGLEDGKQRTLEEVGREFNVTRERIRQIEAKALRKLRHPSRSKRIKDFLE